MSENFVWLGASFIALALLLAVWLVTVPTRTVPKSRRRWQPVKAQPSAWSSGVVSWVDERLWRRPFARRWAYALDRAGIRLPIAEFVVLVVVVGIVGFAAGYVLLNIFAGLIFTVGGLLLLIGLITFRSERRKGAFSALLDDVVQHLATNLRAGHSTVQSLETVGRDVEEPARSELLRAVNQVRIGKDLGDALAETAERMDSDDFRWVAQAVSIHRQVGGNLGEVLDSVSHTIRERQQVRQRVKALSAEGRMSAWVLIGLPIFVGIASVVINPDYMSLLWTREMGIAMLVYGSLSMLAGALWMRKVVTVKF